MEAFAELLPLITGAGPFALFALCFWMLREERKERIASQERERNLTRETLTAINKTTEALRALRLTLVLNRKVSLEPPLEVEDAG